MPYVAPGDAGEGVVWHLGTVSDDYPDFMQEINSNGDTIALKTGKDLPKEGVTRMNHASIDKFKVSDPTSSTKLE